MFEGLPFRYFETLRDAWSGFSRYIPVSEKVEFARALLAAGFRHLDVGLFAPEHRAGQHRYTAKLLAALPPPVGRSYLAFANTEREALSALGAKRLTALGHPYPRKWRGEVVGLKEAWEEAARVLKLAQGRFEPVLYLALGFGKDLTLEERLVLVSRFREQGPWRIVLADRCPLASPSRVYEVVDAMVAAFGADNLGVHLYTRPDPGEVRARVDAALSAGVRWMSGALGGIGGCGEAGNLPSEVVVPYLVDRGYDPGPDLFRLPELKARAERLKERYA